MDKPTSDDLNRQQVTRQQKHWRSVYQRWRQAQLPDSETLARLRFDTREAAEALYGPVREWIARTYGLSLPDHMFTFWAFWLGLSPSERQAAGRFVRPAGLFTYFEAGGRERVPRAGLDHRLAWRYYRDPPEFVPILTGRVDGLHYGLWYDAPSALPTFVAGYYTRDADRIRCAGRTVLEALRAAVGRAARDWYPPANARESEGDLFPTWLLLDAIGEYEAADRAERGNAPLDAFIRAASRERLATCSGIGVVVPAPYDRAVPQPPDVVYETISADAPELTAWIAEAEQACENGQPAFAFVLGHDLHWLSADRPDREEAAWRLFIKAYDVLGYDALAAIATLHHRYRHLPSVQIY